MKSRFFQEKLNPEFCQFLTQEIYKNFLDLKWFVKLVKGIGKDGEKRANDFIAKLETFSDNATAFSYALNALQWHDGKGDLKNSSNLRSVIAKALCKWENITLFDLEQETLKNTPMHPIMSIPTVMYEVEALNRLISHHPMLNMSHS